MTTRREARVAAWRRAMPRPIVTVHVSRAVYEDYWTRSDADGRAELERMVEAGALVVTDPGVASERRPPEE